ncbi:hypothetical protein F0562_031451 [Nyssa sinensis]|uniref:Pectinesterase n=1 Tax=Nyssa sinensis TaxID=561372 RepID=A0A5J5AUH9_9ASTE|nr:hypothetical protein F0562_031451 [Nyssa sinensis]
MKTSSDIMAKKMTIIVVDAVIALLLLAVPIVFSDDKAPIPANKAQLNTWFQTHVKPFSERKGTLAPELAAAEATPKVIKVRKDGSGDFKSITDAVKSIPAGNTQRVIVSIGGGRYNEKVRIERTKPFVTFYGDPKAMPTMVFDGTSAKCGTVESATLIVESNYFSAVNIIFLNSAPRPKGKKMGGQATAFRISGDKAAIYGCQMRGFQDTHLDDAGKHLFKDCYIEGTVDFIFGRGQSIYLNTEIHVIPGDNEAYITAHARESTADNSAFVFVHCSVTGSGKTAVLGRAWRPYSRVIFAYSQLSDAINPEGWSHNYHPNYASTLFYGEYKNTGPGADLAKRVPFTKKLTDASAKPFLNLGFIEASKWLLPPHRA